MNVLGVPSSYTYDLNGNLATKTEGSDAWVYSWNALGQLTKATKNGATQAAFGYDALGRRIERQQGSVTTRSVYDGLNAVAARSGSMQAKTIHGPLVDDPLLTEQAGGGDTYHHADALGSIVRATNALGSVVSGVTYDSWGVIDGAVGEHGFTARDWDAAVGLYFYRARYYDPSLGRFVSEDPIRSRGGLNFYQYVHDNPVLLRDPLGKQAFRPDPTAKTTGAYFICCYGGRLSVCPGTTPAYPVPDTCVRKCALDHEAVHMRDLRPAEGCPSPCEKATNGTPVVGDTGETECRAYTDTKECLKKCSTAANIDNIRLGVNLMIIKYCGGLPQ